MRAALRGIWGKIPGKRLLRQSFVYTLINVLAAFGPLLLIPFLTHVLSAESYGIYGNFIAAMSVAAVLVGLNVDLAVRRNGAAPPAVLKTWVAAALLITSVVTLLGLAAAMLSARQWPALLDMIGIPFTYLPLMVLGGSITVVHNLGLYISTMRQNLKVFAIIRLGNTFLFVALAFGLYLGWRQVIGDVLIARLISLGVIATFSLFWLHRLGSLPRLSELRGGVRPASLGLRYGVPLLPSVFYDPFMSLINRTVLTTHESLAAAGQYALAYQLAQPLQLVAGSIALAMFPHMVRWFDEKTPEARTRLVVTCLAAAGVLAVIWVGYALLALPLVAPWFTNQAYAASIPLVAPLALAFVLGGTSTVVANRYYHSGETWWITFCCLLGVASNAILSGMFPTLAGVAWSLVAGYATTSLWLILGTLADARPTRKNQRN